jgi:hypothetical protein
METTGGRLTELVAGAGDAWTLELLRRKVTVVEFDWPQGECRVQALLGRTVNEALELDTSALPDGNHFVESRAYDGITYSTEARVDFSVSNARAGAAGVYTLPLVAIAVLVAVTAGVLAAVRRKRTAGADRPARPTHRADEAPPPSQGQRPPSTAVEHIPSVSGYATGYSVLPGNVKPGYSHQLVATQEYAPMPFQPELPFVQASRMARDERTGAPYTEADRWSGSTVGPGEEPAPPWEAPEEGAPEPSPYSGEPGSTDEEGAVAPASEPAIVPKKKMPPPRPRPDETVAPAFRCPSCGTAVPVQGRMCRRCDAQDVVKKLEIEAAELERGGMIVTLIHEGIQEAKRALVDMNYEGAKAYAEKAAGKAPIIRERYAKYKDAIEEAKQLIDKAHGKGMGIEDAEASVLLAESFARKGKYGKAGRYARKACSLLSGKEVEPRSDKDED